MTTQVVNFVLSSDEFSGNQAKWNSNEEVARILHAAQKHPEWISQEVRLFPPSSSQKLFKRLDGTHFKQDGYEWKRRKKEVKVTREDHVKLKVNKLEMIAGSYVHSAVVPSFHRRIYWLFEHPYIVLVHYLNVTSEEVKDGQPLRLRIAQSIRMAALNFTRLQLEQQIRPALCCSMRPSEITALLDSVVSLLNSSQSLPALIPFHPPQDLSPGCTDEFGLEEVQVLRLGGGHHDDQQQHGPLERSNSCSSAFRKGLSSVAMHRQPSAFSDTVDRQYLNGLISEYALERDSVALTEAHSVAENGGAMAANFVGHRENSSAASKSPATVIDPDSGSSACSTTGIRQLPPHRGVDDVLHSTSSTSFASPLIEIADFSPDRSPSKGGVKVLIVGGWYLRGHDYTVMFGERQAAATLFHAGVLRCFAPPHSSGVVKLEVYCDGALISHSVPFEYFEVEAGSGGRSPILAEVAQRLSFLRSCLLTDGVDCIRELPEADAETVVLDICNELMRCPVNYALVGQTPRDCSSNSLLHLCAVLNFHRTIRLVLQWRSEVSSDCYFRDFDVVARDPEGQTPLHIAVLHANVQSVEALMSHYPSAADVVDDRGETPQDLAARSRNPLIASTFARCTEASRAKRDGFEKSPPGAESVNSTALWVMTDGETVTDEQRLQRSRGTSARCIGEECSFERSVNPSSDYSYVGSACQNDSPLSSESHHNATSERDGWMHDPLSMDVRVPDSPTTADMWHALTSPHTTVSEGARARMATLAQQIIDALPDRIKESNSSMELTCVDDVTSLSEPSSSGLSVHSRNPFLPNAYVNSSSEWEELLSPLHVTYGLSSSPNFLESDRSGLSEVGPLDVLANAGSSTFISLPSTSSQSPYDGGGGGSAPSSLPTPSTKDLGEFFNTEGMLGPLERHFRDLRLSDGEQRELYEAAKIIQHAYRQYKARLVSQRQNEAERNAAVVIQSYYRRYKQFCYFKKLHKAAVLIQKHYRMHKAMQDPASLDIDESLDTSCLRHHAAGDADPPALMKEHQAALTIQHAYRGHYQRKRQAAARKIQKFMRQSKQKLRKIHESNGDVCTGIAQGTQLSNGSSAELTTDL